ncbi:hypothetical protein AD953_12470 [Acetobacter malorum]|uniref:Uncharacterized protein n=1 Tax=Acetobacter malorum TaxID=178901 RepID=A0A149V202_9PROT|nr:hypothetical protein AD953_12470 [Acetobacter malorum]
MRVEKNLLQASCYNETEKSFTRALRAMQKVSVLMVQGHYIRVEAEEGELIWPLFRLAAGRKFVRSCIL